MKIESKSKQMKNRNTKLTPEIGIPNRDPLETYPYISELLLISGRIDNGIWKNLGKKSVMILS